MKEITIKFNPDGSVEMEAEGFEGQTCLQGTKPYEKAVGISNPQRKMKNQDQNGSAANVRNRNTLQR